jgi:hypothetical protein
LGKNPSVFNLITLIVSHHLGSHYGPELLVLLYLTSIKVGWCHLCVLDKETGLGRVSVGWSLMASKAPGLYNSPSSDFTVGEPP